MFIIQSNIGLRAFPDEMLHHLMGIIPITERTRIADLTGDSSSHGIVGIIVRGRKQLMPMPIVGGVVVGIHHRAHMLVEIPPLPVSINKVAAVILPKRTGIAPVIPTKDIGHDAGGKEPAPCAAAILGNLNAALCQCMYCMAKPPVLITTKSIPAWGLLAYPSSLQSHKKNDIVNYHVLSGGMRDGSLP